MRKDELFSILTQLDFFLLSMIVCHFGAKNFFRMQSTLSIRTVTAKRHVAKLENVSSFKVTPSNRSSSWNCYGQLVSFSCWVLLLLYQLLHVCSNTREAILSWLYLKRGRKLRSCIQMTKGESDRDTKRGRCTLLITVYYTHSFLDLVPLVVANLHSECKSSGKLIIVRK